MASLLALCVLVLSVSVNAHNGYPHRQHFFKRTGRPCLHHLLAAIRPMPQQKSMAVNPFLKSAKVNPDDHKCSTIVRRPYFMTKWLQLPCQRIDNTMPVVRSFMGPMGPMCVTYIREPVVRYFKIHSCCPGFRADNQGKCTIRINAMNTNKNTQKARSNMNMMPLVAKMRQQMWQRAKNDMERRRSEMMMRMRPQQQQQQQQRQMMFPQKRPMAPKMINLYKMNGGQRPPKVAFLSFKGLPGPFMPPRVVKRPPFNRGFITLIKRKVLRPDSFFMKQMKAMTAGRPVPRLIMSGRHQPLAFNPMGEFHPQMPEPMRRINRFEPPQMQLSKGQQQMAEPVPQPEEMPSNNFQQPSSGFFSVNAPNGLNQFNEVNLPDTPVEMPELIVEEAPKPTTPNMNCIVALESAVKSCLKDSNIEVPDVMTAFEPFNEDMSRYLCEAEETIFACINAAMNDCNDSSDAIVARGMLQETAQTVRSMCELRAISVQDQGTSENQQDLTVQGADTVATVENVDAIPVRDTSADVVSDPSPETAAPSEPTMAPSKNVGVPEVHVQEIKVNEFLLPVLLGAGLGFMILVLLISLLLCCCCRRRVAKKMTMAQEPEKPPMKDEIYTIGVSPPLYETQGIPPMYYEEAKGEKISSREMAETAEAAPADESA